MRRVPQGASRRTTPEGIDGERAADGYDHHGNALPEEREHRSTNNDTGAEDRAAGRERHMRDSAVKAIWRFRSLFLRGRQNQARARS